MNTEHTEEVEVDHFAESYKSFLSEEVEVEVLSVH